MQVLQKSTCQYPASNTSNTDNLSVAIAKTILNGFERHFCLFQAITDKTKGYFEKRLWQKIEDINRERIYFYKERVKECTQQLNKYYNLEVFNELLWRQVKQDYIKLIIEHKQPELAETFFNSAFCHSFDKRFYNNQFIFVHPSISTDYLDLDSPIIYSYCTEKGDPSKHFSDILTRLDFSCPYQDIKRDIKYLTQQFNQYFCFDISYSFEIQIIQTLFFRNKVAYIFGRVVTELGSQPLCITLLNDKKTGIYVDALLMNRKLLAQALSFTHSYFLVNTDTPATIVSFLQTLLPNKTSADLYSVIGFQKHGKTLLYRMFLHHTKSTSETLKIAPGIAGMVMLVFTFPVYLYVFKLIRDHFKPPKDINRQAVKDTYQMVKNHSRIGRMADTWEFSNVAFPISKIDPKLLEELKTEARSSIEFDKDLLIIKHLYIERKMRPLNMYLQTANESEIEHIVKDYGMAIKELIHANIFPGDLLSKNFGVTRQKRVVFYDYDEIVTMDEVNFRKLPQPETHEQEMASEPWYYVAYNDVFPEDFCHFLFNNAYAKAVFLQYHADLLQASYWQSVQQAVAKGEVADIFPYDSSHRMSTIYA